MEGDPVIDGTPFSKLMDQAVKLRTHSHAPLRSKFDKWPRWYQNSMFSREDVDKHRALPFQERLNAMQKRKELAEDFMQRGDFLQAANEFETALGIFKYLHNINPNWKKKGIYDEQIEEVDNLGSTPEERKEAGEAMVDILLILTRVYEHSKERKAALEACDSAISLMPNAARAYLRRAEVRVAPVSAGATEQDIAIKDLQQALQIDPTDQEIRNLLNRLRLARRKQMERDKKTFAGLFDRGSIVKKSELKKLEQQKHEAAEQAKKKPIKEPGSFEGIDLQAQIQAAQKLAKDCKKEGRMEDYRALKDHVKNAKSVLKRKKAGLSGNKADQEPAKPDFQNPTPEMIEEAKRQGIDLTDPRVVDMLEQLQKETEGKERIDEDDQNKEDFAPSAALIEKTIRGMDPKEVREMLVQEGGVDPKTMASMSDQDAMELAVKLYAHDQNSPEKMPLRRSSPEQSKSNTNTSVWVFSFTVAALAFLYRMYSSGLLSWFMQHYGVTLGRKDISDFDDYDDDDGYQYLDESDDYDY